MGRKENREKAKYLRKKLTAEQFNALKNSANQSYIDDEVEKQIKHYQKFFSICLVEAFKKNKISESKALIILDDVKSIMREKVAEKKNKTGIRPEIKGSLD